MPEEFIKEKNEKTMFCTNCGAEIKNNAVVCIGCGVEIKKDTTQKKIKKPIHYITTTIVIILLILLIPVIIILSNKDLTERISYGLNSEEYIKDIYINTIGGWDYITNPAGNHTFRISLIISNSSENNKGIKLKIIIYNDLNEVIGIEKDFVETSGRSHYSRVYQINTSNKIPYSYHIELTR